MDGGRGGREVEMLRLRPSPADVVSFSNKLIDDELAMLRVVFDGDVAQIVHQARGALWGSGHRITLRQRCIQELRDRAEMRTRILLETHQAQCGAVLGGHRELFQQTVVDALSFDAIEVAAATKEPEAMAAYGGSIAPAEKFGEEAALIGNACRVKIENAFEALGHQRAEVTVRWCTRIARSLAALFAQSSR